jgi:hypothetical protein
MSKEKSNVVNEIKLTEIKTEKKYKYLERQKKISTNSNFF